MPDGRLQRTRESYRKAEPCQSDRELIERAKQRFWETLCPDGSPMPGVVYRQAGPIEPTEDTPWAV